MRLRSPGLMSDANGIDESMVEPRGFTALSSSGALTHTKPDQAMIPRFARLDTRDEGWVLNGSKNALV